MIGDAENPIRASGATSMKRCPGGYLLEAREDRKGSKASDTGTAVGLMIELYHRDMSPDEAVGIANRAKEAGHDGGHPFPEADLEDAETAFRLYASDPRNSRDVVLRDSLELEVHLVVPPHPSDNSGAPIHVTGHLDQARIGPDGCIEVWDVKHSKKRPEELLGIYSWQQALYTQAAGLHYGKPVRWGGLIRTRAYLERQRVPDDDPGTKRKFKLVDRDPADAHAFIHSGYTPAMIDRVIVQFRRTVARIRNGEIDLLPGDHCFWCPAGSFNVCSQEFPV